jgi:AraC family transcriptional regulator
MSEFTIRPLLTTPLVAVRDVTCRGSCHHKSHEEAPQHVHLVFPYRGVYVRHVGGNAAIAEANQALMFNVDEGYRVSHPVHGGDACLDFVIDDAQLRELAPAALVRPGAQLAFDRQHIPLDPGTQALVARLRHTLARGTAEPLAAETAALALVRRALGAELAPPATAARRRIVDRAKLVLASDLSRRWTLSEIAGELGVSPVYLTQVFHQVEGVPLYRYQLRLRLSCALDRVARADDLTTLALDLGFTSHSHFTAAFRQLYGQAPSAFRRAAG